MLALTKLAAPARTALTQSTRQMTVVSAPPRVHISPAEKFVHGIAIAIGMLVVPAWVMVNIKNYKARD